MKSQIVIWTAGFVLLTLLINAPLLPTLLRWTKLGEISQKQFKRRQRALEALKEHTVSAIEQLKEEEDELLSGESSVLSPPTLESD